MFIGVFTEYNHWWVVPVIACHVGAVAGAWLYYLAVEINWPDEDEKINDVDKMNMRRIHMPGAQQGCRNRMQKMYNDNAHTVI